MKFDVVFSGDTDFAQPVAALFESLKVPAAQILLEEFSPVLNLSKEIVPVDQGPLRNSGQIGVRIDSDGPVATIGYGGGAVTYAAVQHETPPEIFTHAPGRSWKFLERPAMAYIPTLVENLASRLAALFIKAGRP